MANDGGPAFSTDARAWSQGYSGMSLRDWFAGKALPRLSSDTLYDNWSKMAAKQAYLWADAMLAEREKEAS